ncbi:methyltransferase domain-containing protein [Allokutzneria sp. A3M-2-11 16]|nr:methyltransferase domain-containing protein [Allokutzneria sp. A3M-2-11 16]
MGHTWHHADPAAEARGLTGLAAAQELEEQVVALAGLKPGDYALDFGSGVGGETVYMAKVASCNFVGLCNNEGLSARARALAEKTGMSDKVNFFTIGDEDYKTLVAFPDACLDAVIFYESVCHLPDKAAFFRAAYRILKPGGRIVGLDWLQRPFGEYQTEEQILGAISGVNEYYRIAWHGTVDKYREMMTEAGFDVTLARDLFEGVKCWGSTPDGERPQWTNYEGPEGEFFRKGKVALDAARDAGVFTVGLFAATKRA